jgi:SAM-dependent methyltransferase
MVKSARMPKGEEPTTGYFAARGVPLDGPPLPVPRYLAPRLPAERTARILDIGCGPGALLLALREAGYTNAEGVDVDAPAVAAAVKRGLAVERIDSLDGFLSGRPASYDVAIMSHVLEHLPKPEIVPTLTRVRGALRPGGRLFLMVPNAQSSTGAYWAFEDFTHSTLFTSGSVLYVLRKAGFGEIEFLDPDATAASSGPVRLVRKLLLPLYRARESFWNRVTGSAWHAASPPIFGYEIKATAVNPPGRP